MSEPLFEDFEAERKRTFDLYQEVMGEAKAQEQKALALTSCSKCGYPKPEHHIYCANHRSNRKKYVQPKLIP